MANTFFGLTIGKSGLYAASTAMNTTAHNIANTETEGYSRQVTSQQASKALQVNSSYGMVGTGVDVTGVDQVRDEYYDVKYRANNTLYGEYATKNYYMTEIENYFNEIQLEGFTTTFDDMYESMQELQKNPADLTVRTQMTNYASAFCEYFNYMSTNLSKIQEEINYEIGNQVSKINSIGVQVAELTKQINSLEVLGGTASDLRDQRALLIDDLSEIVEVNVSETSVDKEVGAVNYTVRINGQILVDTYNSNQLECVPRENKTTMTDVEGLYDIAWVSTGQEFNASTSVTSGSLSSLYELMEGNDEQAFKGMVEAYEGDTTITMTSEFGYMNDVTRLNLPATGTLTIGNRDYDYNGFSVSQDDDGNLIYEFSLDEPLVKDTDSINPVTEPVTGIQYNTIIGSNIDYKGIPYYMSQLNEFVRTFAKSYNDLTTSGVDLNGDEGLDFFNATDVVTGANYEFTEDWPYDTSDDTLLFTSKTGTYAIDDDIENYGSYYFMTAGNFCVTEAVAADSTKVVTATDISDGVENTDIIDQLLDLKENADMFKQGDPAAYLETMVAEIGIDTKKASQFSANQEDIIQNVQNQRLSVSGVDQDEEAMNLVRYQSAYNLSSKVISVMDEMYDRLINYMGA